MRTKTSAADCYTAQRDADAFIYHVFFIVKCYLSKFMMQSCFLSWIQWRTGECVYAILHIQ